MVTLLISLALASEPDPALVRALPSSRVTLEDGIRQAAVAPAVAISAKLEMDDGKLLLSVYTADKGLSADAESNVLAEKIGAATNDRWTPAVEVFADVPHVARSAEQLTVLRQTSSTLLDVIARARKDLPGTVFSVTPTVRGGKPVFVVLVASDGTVKERAYDLQLNPR